MRPKKTSGGKYLCFHFLTTVLLFSYHFLIFLIEEVFNNKYTNTIPNQAHHYIMLTIIVILAVHFSFLTGFFFFCFFFFS